MIHLIQGYDTLKYKISLAFTVQTVNVLDNGIGQFTTTDHLHIPVDLKQILIH